MPNGPDNGARAVGPLTVTIGGGAEFAAARRAANTPDPTDFIQNTKEYIAGYGEMRRVRAVVVQEVEGPSVERQPEFARRSLRDRDNPISLRWGESLRPSRVLPILQALDALVVESFDPCADGGRAHPKRVGDLLDGLLSHGQQHNTGPELSLVGRRCVIGIARVFDELGQGRHFFVGRLTDA